MYNVKLQTFRFDKEVVDALGSNDIKRLLPYLLSAKEQTVLSTDDLEYANYFIENFKLQKNIKDKYYVEIEALSMKYFMKYKEVSNERFNRNYCR